MSENHISLQIQKDLSQALNYNQILFEQFENYLGNRILEVGCSLGNISQLLLENTTAKLYSSDLLEEAVRQVLKLKAIYPSRIQAEIWDLNFPPPVSIEKRKYSGIVCVNVLEHIGRDRRAIDYLYNLLDEGGYLCLLVPALPVLYGSVDRSDHHFRRYTKKEIIKIVNMRGLNLINCYYFNFFGIFGWFLMGRILKRKKIGAISIRIYDKIFPLLYKLEQLFGYPPIGQSLILIAKK
jgi:2-polyprenyl-3-methyl-5-hydroxy-6-metoxy-1,4-benzoquinol methylase